MLLICPVPDGSHDPSAEQARILFRHYADFLREKFACGTFDFARFEEEIAALPAPYAARGGELLLATLNGIPAGCLGFRATAGEATCEAATCEIKRLFVLPAFRGHSLARTLVAEALRRIAARNFTRVILDTDTINMPAAHALYLSFGFVEYARKEHHLAFLQLSLT